MNGSKEVGKTYCYYSGRNNDIFEIYKIISKKEDIYFYEIIETQFDGYGNSDTFKEDTRFSLKSFEIEEGTKIKDIKEKYPETFL